MGNAKHPEIFNTKNPNCVHFRSDHVLYVLYYFFSDSDDLESMSKAYDGSGSSASLQAVPPTMPPPPPPPVGGTDMSAYGNYSAWYQVCKIFRFSRVILNRAADRHFKIPT